MQIAGLSLWSAPQATGHLPGVPGDQTDATPPARKVHPISASRNPEAALTWARTPPTQFWRTAIGAPDPAAQTAPPSIMQIKISQMLDAQASALQDQEDQEAKAEDARPVDDTHGADMIGPDTDAAKDPQAEAGNHGAKAVPSGIEATKTTPAPVLRDTPEPAVSGRTEVAVPGYAEAATLSRNPVFSTLP